MTVFNEVHARIEKPAVATPADLASLQARDEEAFAGVEAFLTAQMHAMRAAGFSARITKREGAPNGTLEWHPGNPGELPARTTATFEVEAPGGGRHKCYIHYLNDEAVESAVFFSCLHLTPKILEAWFAAFVDLCLTARLDRAGA